MIVKRYAYQDSQMPLLIASKSCKEMMLDSVELIKRYGKTYSRLLFKDGDPNNLYYTYFSHNYHGFVKEVIEKAREKVVLERAFKEIVDRTQTPFQASRENKLWRDEWILKAIEIIEPILEEIEEAEVETERLKKRALAVGLPETSSEDEVATAEKNKKETK